MAPTFNDSYLNRTPNKTPRAASQTPFSPLGAVLHETAGLGSLDWNLRADVRSSYNYLIRLGRIYRYVDETRYISWGAGVNSAWTLGNQRYVGGALNAFFVQIELEGPNDGTPMDPRNLAALVELMIYLNARYRIPLIPAYWPEHWQVAPGYKTDAAGYNGATQVDLAARRLAGGVPAPELANRAILGVAPSITPNQYMGMITDHGGLRLASRDEWMRLYEHAAADEVDPAFLMAVAKHETGSPLGMSPLALRTRQLWNIRAPAGDWRPTVSHNGGLWYAEESVYQGGRRAIHHFKQYGWDRGASQPEPVRDVGGFIRRYAPEMDGNNTTAYIASVLTDMAYMRQRAA